jgi:hypothetical protein
VVEPGAFGNAHSMMVITVPVVFILGRLVHDRRLGIAVLQPGEYRLAIANYKSCSSAGIVAHRAVGRTALAGPGFRAFASPKRAGRSSATWKKALPNAFRRIPPPSRETMDS